MKGWVYVITNKAMPGLVKVGYSTKDPELRAAELNHTGSPYPYLVEYELLINEPYLIEQTSHKKLAHCREGKEWFRCEPEEAIAAIKQTAGVAIIHEVYTRAERTKVEAIFQEELRVKEEQEKAKLAEKEIEDHLSGEEEFIRAKYKGMVTSRFPERPFWYYWLGTTICVFIIAAFADASGDAMALVLPGGFIGAFFAKNFLEEQKKKSPAYTALQQQMKTELSEVREKVVACDSCGNKLRLNKSKILLSNKETRWSCPKCRSLVSLPYDA